MWRKYSTKQRSGTSIAFHIARILKPDKIDDEVKGESI